MTYFQEIHTDNKVEVGQPWGTGLCHKYSYLTHSSWSSLSCMSWSNFYLLSYYLQRICSLVPVVPLQINFWISSWSTGLLIWSTSYSRCYPQDSRRTQANATVSPKGTHDRIDFNCSAPLECHLLSPPVGQSNDLSFWSSGLNLTRKERTLGGFLENESTNRAIQWALFPPNGFLKQLLSHSSKS